MQFQIAVNVGKRFVIRFQADLGLIAFSGGRALQHAIDQIVSTVLLDKIDPHLQSRGAVLMQRVGSDRQHQIGVFRQIFKTGQ